MSSKGNEAAAAGPKKAHRTPRVMFRAFCEVQGRRATPVLIWLMPASAFSVQEIKAMINQGDNTRDGTAAHVSELKYSVRREALVLIPSCSGTAKLFSKE